MSIDPHDISVVVQGPITGSLSDPPHRQLTRLGLESLRRFLPGAKLILSTWAGSDRREIDCDIYVETPDPGAVSYWKPFTVPYNVNRQIVSTNAGLRYADRRWAMKIRSDLIVTGTGFLELWEKFPTRNPEWQVFRERVVVSSWPTCNPRRCPLPFALSDWFTFGLQEDVAHLWARSPASDSEIARYFETHPRPVPDKHPDMLSRYNAEQYIWLGCLREHGEIPCDHIWDYSSHNRDLAAQVLVNNVILADPARLGLEFRKYDFRTSGLYHFYTYPEWLDLYRHYCDPTFRLSTSEHLALWRDRMTLWPRFAFARLRDRLRSRLRKEK